MSYESKALNAADDLLDAYPHAVDSMEGLRNLLAMAWLKGSQVGASETAAIVEGELDRMAHRV